MSVKPKVQPKIPQLQQHANGQHFITKRINGRKKFYYFGRDPEAAHREFLRQLPDILAGRQPRTATDVNKVSCLELTDRFVAAQEQRLKDGEIGARQFDDLRRSAAFFLAWSGEQTTTASIVDLQDLRSYLMRRMRLHAFNRNITNIKAVLRWGYRHKPRLLPEALHEEDALSKAKAKHVRRERRQNEETKGKPIYGVAECRVEIRAAAVAENWELLSFMLLALNAGMGQTHISVLPLKPVDFDKLYVDWIRTKTEEICQFTLWPVTAAAMRMAIDRRPKAKDKANDGLCFLTANGQPWVQVFVADDAESPGAVGAVSPNDEIGKAHRLLEETLTATEIVAGKPVERPIKRAGRAFYAFRRTFSTIANDVPDKDAVRRIMGHSLTGNDPSYVRAIPVERLRNVTDYVHRKLFACEPADLTLQNLAEKLSPDPAAPASPA